MANLVEEGIRAAGGLTALSTALGVKPPSVCKWAKRGRVPALRVLDFERATGISRHELRSDLYPVEGDPVPAAAQASA